MSPEIIAVGETQERLLWVVPPDVVAEIVRIYNEEFTLPEVAYNARATVIGRVTAERRYVLLHRGAVVMDVESDFLTDSIRDELPYTEVIRHAGPVEELPAVDVETVFPRVLVASRRRVARAALSALRCGRARLHGLAARRGRCRRPRTDLRLAAWRRTGRCGQSALRTHRCGATRPSMRFWRRCAGSSPSARGRSVSPTA